jgi:type I restriction enzyme, R subunit
MEGEGRQDAQGYPKCGGVELTTFIRSVVEQVALGRTVKHRLDIAPGTLLADREGHGEVVLKQRLRDALARLNPDLPTEAMEDTFAVSRKLRAPR